MDFDITTLITDRTRADVERRNTLAERIAKGTATAAELAEWNTAALKGAYNYTDLNRVGDAIQYVADRLNSYGCAVSVAPKRDWEESDIPTSKQMVQYLADLAKLRNAITLTADVPPVPGSMVKLTHEEANNIEQILKSVDLMLTLAAQAWVYSGEVYSGEV